MAKATRKFRDNFDAWSQYKIAAGHFTVQGIEELRALIRIDLTPGPDQMRAECEFFTIAGVKIPATIDDHEERYKLWDDFFAAEVADIQLAERQAA